MESFQGPTSPLHFHGTYRRQLQVPRIRGSQRMNMNGHLPTPPRTFDCRTGSEFSLTGTAGWRCRKMVRVPGSCNLLLVTMGGQMKHERALTGSATNSRLPDRV
ncbi:hypothetical protein Adt_20192 [Abeliophyllum distichum]|uniref:Uncharacterized protein n=1 Tax=Abeliophyllum distichum TaxID=126358 RepID=A0ABD1SVU9_9LAMI